MVHLSPSHWKLSDGVSSSSPVLYYPYCYKTFSWSKSLSLSTSCYIHLGHRDLYLHYIVQQESLLFSHSPVPCIFLFATVPEEKKSNLEEPGHLYTKFLFTVSGKWRAVGKGWSVSLWLDFSLRSHMASLNSIRFDHRVSSCVSLLIWCPCLLTYQCNQVCSQWTQIWGTFSTSELLLPMFMLLHLS